VVLLGRLVVKDQVRALADGAVNAGELDVPAGRNGEERGRPDGFSAAVKATAAKTGMRRMRAGLMSETDSQLNHEAERGDVKYG
jgi:hypothetical protein